MWNEVVANEIMYIMTETEYKAILQSAGVPLIAAWAVAVLTTMFVYERHISQLKKKWGIVEKIETVRKK